jgi:uncharacterized membrane protein
MSGTPDSGNPNLPTPRSSVPEELKSEIEKRLQSELKTLPADKRSRLVAEVASLTVQFSGPLPPPHMLQKYNEILPGAADRILTMAEKEQQFEIDMNKTLVHCEQKYRMTGLVCGLLVSLASFGTAIAFAAAGDTTTGAVFGGVTLFGIVTAFIGGQYFLASQKDASENEPNRPSPKKKKKK